MAQPPRSGLVLAAVNRWNASHPARPVDPQAELRVAGVEGLSGAVGDQGHAFGPNQANDAGGTLTGMLPGLSPAQKNAWAWSPQGLAFQLAGVAHAAGGEHGRQAIVDIIRRYERPADPNGEVARALATGGGGMPASSPTGQAPQAQGMQGNPHLLQILLATREAVGLPPPGQALTRALQARLQPQQSQAQPQLQPQTRQAAAAPAHNGHLAELLLEGTGGPTHSTGPHVHVASTNPQTMLQLLQLGRSLGLTELENPYVDPVNPSVHAKNSFHDRTFAGLYNGRRLGEATDFSGPGMQRFYQLVRQRFGAPSR